MKLRFTRRATENIVGIADFVRARNPTSARAVRSAIYESLKLLLVFPNLGREQTAEGVRKLVTRKFAYLVYYAIDRSADEVIILAVKHPAQERERTDR